MDAVGLLAGAGWGSGINLYLVVLVLGVAQRLGWSDLPEAFGRTDVLVAAALLFAVEFVADKVPYLDNLWDAVHTVVRPLGAAALGAVLAGASPSVGAALGGLVAAALALNAHGAKATTRLTMNASPEPVSNLVLSVVEDVAVVGLVALALERPELAAVVVAVLVVAAAAITLVVVRTLRGLGRRLRDAVGRAGRWRRRTSPAVSDPDVAASDADEG